MQRSLVPLLVLLLLVAFTVLPARAQTPADIERAVAEADFAPQLSDNNQLLLRAQRLVNIENLPNRTAAALAEPGNEAPGFAIAPDIRTIRVGERIVINFTFTDRERDPFFGGVIAVNAPLDLEAGRKTRKQIMREAPVLLNVLASEQPGVIRMGLVAQNPGVCIFFVSIAELFSSVEDGQLKLRSGRIKHLAYALRVVSDEHDQPGARPQFLDRFERVDLRLRERTNFTFAAQSPDRRPLIYNFLFLAFASRLVNGSFQANRANVRAIEPGQGIFVAYVTDGRDADVQSFLVTVADPKDPPSVGLRLRAVSPSAFIGERTPVKLLLYGDNFTPGARAVLFTARGEETLPTRFLKPNKLSTEIPVGLLINGLMQLRVDSEAGSSNLLNVRALPPTVISVKLVRGARDLVTDIRLVGLGLTRNTMVFVNSRRVERVEDRSGEAFFGDQYTIRLPEDLRALESVEIVIVSVIGFASEPIVVPLRKR